MFLEVGLFGCKRNPGRKSPDDFYNELSIRDNLQLAVPVSHLFKGIVKSALGIEHLPPGKKMRR